MTFVKRVERVALAVENLDEARTFFENTFGAVFEPIARFWMRGGNLIPIACLASNCPDASACIPTSSTSRTIAFAPWASPSCDTT